LLGMLEEGKEGKMKWRMSVDDLGFAQA